MATSDQLEQAPNSMVKTAPPPHDVDAENGVAAAPQPPPPDAVGALLRRSNSTFSLAQRPTLRQAMRSELRLQAEGRARKKSAAPHFGDEDFYVEVLDGLDQLFVDEKDEAGWDEIFRSCCFHTRMEWLHIGVGVIALLFFLYFFVFGILLLGSASKVMAGCASGELLSLNVRSTCFCASHFVRYPHTYPYRISIFFYLQSNPVSSLMIGIITTFFLQSSSTVTGIVVALEEVGILDVDQGIYMVRRTQSFFFLPKTC